MSDNPLSSGKRRYRTCKVLVRDMSGDPNYFGTCGALAHLLTSNS
jgi:hypothetical protein